MNAQSFIENHEPKLDFTIFSPVEQALIFDLMEQYATVECENVLPDQNQIENIEKIIKKHEDLIRTYHNKDDVARTIETLLDYYMSKASQEIIRMKELRDDMVANMQAIQIVVESIGVAQTHGEKNSRIRGLLDVINIQIKKLRNDTVMGFDDDWNHSSFSYSEYPLRGYIEKLKQENAMFKSQLKQDSKEAPELLNF